MTSRFPVDPRTAMSRMARANETMADRLLVLVPHEQTHAPRSMLEQARKLGPASADVTEMRAIKHLMELIVHSLCIANKALAKVARDGRPGKTALLHGQSMGTKSELHQGPEFTDAHWQLMVGLKSQIAKPAEPMVICAKLCPLGRSNSTAHVINLSLMRSRTQMSKFI